LKLQYNEALSNFAFNFNLRRYIEALHRTGGFEHQTRNNLGLLLKQSDLPAAAREHLAGLQALAEEDARGLPVTDEAEPCGARSRSRRHTLCGVLKMLEIRLGRYCSPRHRTLFNSRNEV
jgi:hypothetical protein